MQLKHLNSASPSSSLPFRVTDGPVITSKHGCLRLCGLRRCEHCGQVCFQLLPAPRDVMPKSESLLMSHQPVATIGRMPLER